MTNAAAISSSAQQPFYQLQYLPPLTPGAYAVVSDINSVGDAVGGELLSSGDWEAILWRNGSAIDLGPGFAISINNRGAIVGADSVGAKVWDPDIIGNGYFNIGRGLTARSINNVDAVVGPGVNFYTGLGLPDNLAFNPGPAVSINDLNQAVTNFGAGSAKRYPNFSTDLYSYAGGLSYLWEGTMITPLPSLPTGDNFQANSISNLGVIVGNANSFENSSNLLRAVQWKDGQIQNLGRLPNAPVWAGSGANDINTWGLIVGHSEVFSVAGIHAVLWKGGHIVDLTTLVQAPGWSLMHATAVNDRGDIVGTGYLEGVGPDQPFLLTHYYPLPEPSYLLSVLFASIGLIGLIRCRRGGRTKSPSVIPGSTLSRRV